jgi:hypothetical protein
LDHQAPNDDEAMRIKFLKKYGVEDWYHWCISNWGTKWNVNPSVWGKPHPFEIWFGFDTAWGPPDKALQRLSKLVPKAKMVLLYCEPGMFFAGKLVYKDGKLIHKEYTQDDTHKLFAEFGYDYDSNHDTDQ